MTIGKIYISEQELRQALQDWLRTKGVTIIIACFQKSYSNKPESAWEIDGMTADELALAPELPAEKPGKAYPDPTMPPRDHIEGIDIHNKMAEER